MGRLSRLLGVSSGKSGQSDTQRAYPSPPASSNNTASSRHSGATSVYTNTTGADSTASFHSPAPSSHSSLRAKSTTPPQTSATDLPSANNAPVRPGHHGTFPMHARSSSNDLMPPPSHGIYNSNRYSRSLTILSNARGDSPVYGDSNQPNRIVDTTSGWYSSNITGSRPSTSGADSSKPAGTALLTTPQGLLTWTWIDRGRSHSSYHFGPLGRCEKVPDLYNPDGDTVVYLAMKNGEYSQIPSFRINSSPLMHTLLESYIKSVDEKDSTPSPRGSSPGSNGSRPPNSRHGSSRTSLWKYGQGSRPASPGNALDEESEGLKEAPAQFKINWPHSEPTEDAMETLKRSIDTRNLFAFLDKSFLVGAKDVRDSVFDILEDIRKRIVESVPEVPGGGAKRRRGRLQQLPLEEAQPMLAFQARELGFDDVRYNHEKMLQVLKLAEDWHHDAIYHDVFIHCVGNWETAKLKDNHLVQTISKATIEHIEKSVIDLENKLKTLNTRLEHFTFAALEHILSTEKWCEKGWKAGFLAMKKLTLDHYKYLYGSWPPKPNKSGKGGAHPTRTGGLNRITLQKVYDDFIGLYELLVDHNSKYMETTLYEPQEEVEKNLLRILSHFDTSDMPNQPPMPFSLPLIPKIPGDSSTKRKFHTGELKKIYEETGYNKFDYPKDKRLIEAFMTLEMKSSQSDVAGLRRGRWIFIYAVLQSLVLTACDAPNLSHNIDVEYFLCEGARLGAHPPWQVGGRSRPLSMLLMTDMNMAKNLGDVEATYETSKCWQLAKKWRAELDPENAQSVQGDYEDIIQDSPRPSETPRYNSTPPPPIMVQSPLTAPMMSSRLVQEPHAMSPVMSPVMSPTTSQGPVRWVPNQPEHSPQMHHTSSLHNIEEHAHLIASPPPQHMVIGGHHYTYQEPSAAAAVTGGRRIVSESLQQQVNRAGAHHEPTAEQQGLRRFSAPYTLDGANDSRPVSRTFDDIIPGLDRMSMAPSGLYGRSGPDGITPPRSPSPAMSPRGSITSLHSNSPRSHSPVPELPVVSPRLPTPKFNKFSWEPVQESKLKEVVAKEELPGRAE